MTTKTIYVLNGPNLNLLGTREPEIYGHDTLDDIAGRLDDQARALGFEIDFRQSNHEGHLIDWLHEANADGAHAVLLNAAAYTHTSFALYDAIKAISVPVIEVHISNPHLRESYRLYQERLTGAFRILAERHGFVRVDADGPPEIVEPRLEAAIDPHITTRTTVAAAG